MPSHRSLAGRTRWRRVGPVTATNRHRHTTVQSRRELFEEAAAIVALEYPDRLELEMVARRLATSPRQLQRAFAEPGRTSFRTYLCAVRMEHAGELLRDGSLRIWEVAEAVGYSQPAQFAKAFRRHHGCPPSAFRATRRSRTLASGALTGSRVGQMPARNAP
jgi:AraC family transcriptional regulator, regulatory protein of adaptative response / methylphosphotriester-DNA alkyltransferase methyltransferase